MKDRYLYLGLNAPKKELPMFYLVNKPGGKVRSIEFECVLRMTMESKERKALMIYSVYEIFK
jgi:hypothetical protein